MEIKKNNNISNLEWCTLQENMKHAWENNLCKNSTPSGDISHHKKINKKISNKIREDLEIGLSYSKIAKKYGISKSTVYQINKKITWK